MTKEELTAYFAGKEFPNHVQVGAGTKVVESKLFIETSLVRLNGPTPLLSSLAYDTLLKFKQAVEEVRFTA